MNDPEVLFSQERLGVATRRVVLYGAAPRADRSGKRKDRLSAVICYSQIFPRKFGAGEGIRTLDPNLGKVVLYP